MDADGLETKGVDPGKREDLRRRGAEIDGGGYGAGISRFLRNEGLHLATPKVA